MIIPNITKDDMLFILNNLDEKDKKELKDSVVLITGFAGSLGYTLLHFFAMHGEELGVKKVYGIDNYMFGKPGWIERIINNPLFDLRQMDIVNCGLEFAKDANIIFHMASLASPVYYRIHPIETIDADVIGLRRLLDFYKHKHIKGFLFYSSSEAYGDPPSCQIPTKEDYWGNVNPCGPRACYDESKRMGETLCYNFVRQYNMPVTVVRPFNNFGPGMRINDKRVVADFAKAIVDDEDIIIYSDGSPTRTFHYIPDATIGYIKCALYGKFDIFNIGAEAPEIDISTLASLYKKVGNMLFGYDKNIIYKTHEDKDYLTDNPKRRCPNIDKAKTVLNYHPSIGLEEGLRRYLLYLKECNRREFE